MPIHCCPPLQSSRNLRAVAMIVHRIAIAAHEIVTVEVVDVAVAVVVNPIPRNLLGI